MPNPTPLEVAIHAINNAPRLSESRIHWSAVPDTMVKVAVAVLSSTDRNATIAKITEATGVMVWTIQNFVRGKDACSRLSHEVRAGIAAAGFKHDDIDRRNGKKTRGASKTDAAPAPAADHVPAAPVTLATTNKGEVIVTTPPPPPTTMAAKPGEFATRTDAPRCVLDTKTKDILVITTRRIEFGTPAWCEKMVEINSKPKA